MKYLSFFLLLFVLVGCKTKVVTVEQIRDVYHNITDTIRDSISHEVFINQYIKGDTVYKDRVEYLYKDRWRTHDSIVIQRDSIPYPVEVIKEVQKPMPFWMYVIVLGAFLVLLFKFLNRSTV